MRHKIYSNEWIGCPTIALGRALVRKGGGEGSCLESRLHYDACSTNSTFPLARWAPMQPATVDPTMHLTKCPNDYACSMLVQILDMIMEGLSIDRKNAN